MGRAGIVLGLEVSRLARNNADWQRLLEICALSGTLICDEDGLYDPADFNDRLLLGLKGTMSEAELHIIRARLVGGQRSKARRGELRLSLPTGLVYDAADNVALDPDAEVQGAIRCVFDTFARTGSARAVVQHFTANTLLIPCRIRTGEHKGELTWAQLNHARVLSLLHNPRYAGAFAYGRHRQTRTLEGKTSLLLQPCDQWIALIPDTHPGYITFDRWQANQDTLAANAAARGPDRAAGPAREGPALLQGLAICGNCGKRMTVRYHRRGNREVPDYQCVRQAISTGTKACQVVPGADLDNAVAALLVAMVTPLAIDAALEVHTELQARAAEADILRAQHVQRAQTRADLARRRYLAVDPDNRLVADNLEADWNRALLEVREAQDTYDNAAAKTDAALSAQRQTRLRALAQDFPALWSDPATCDKDRKRIARLLIEDATIVKTDSIVAQIRLRGGQTRRVEVPLPTAIGDQRRTDPHTVARADALLDEHTDTQTADLLNAANLTTGVGRPFTPTAVQRLRKTHQLPSHAQRLREAGWLTLTEMATRYHVHPFTIKNWDHDGLLTSTRANDKAQRYFRIPDQDPRDLPRRKPRPKRKTTTTTQPASGGAV
jgi:DNA invertase Pin-like site-specific DNA recombinase